MPMPARAGRPPMVSVVFFAPNFRLVRAEDHVVLDVSVIGLQQGHVDTPQGRRYVLTGTGQLRVRFGSQQILEYAARHRAAPGPPSGPGRTCRSTGRPATWSSR